MTTHAKILQGTDGIRGRVALTDDLEGLSPLEYFLEKGLLTPAFYELYTYTYGQLMLKEGGLDTGATIVIGWDPRDASGKFNQAALNGLCKSGLNVVVTGILPTPAIPLYMLQIGAAGSVVLTASHNPADQNGIKLFHGGSGLKFLPDDDRRLSEALFQLHHTDLKALKQSGQAIDHSGQARQFFIDFSTAESNAGLTGAAPERIKLVVDASRGAVAQVAQDIFSAFPFRDVIYTNLNGDINKNCGVADIEGREMITAADVQGENARFQNYETLQTLFKAGQTDPDVQNGTINLSGLVFDGDGDRCFRLDYQPEADRLLVSSGDFLGFHQARQQHTTRPANGRWFVNTVESDLNTAVSAQKLGYEAVLTGVGDKWILLRAILDQMQTETEPETPAGQQLLQWIEANQNNTALSGIELSRLWRKVYSSKALRPGQDRYQFAIGFEESGHCITPGVLSTEQGQRRCFAGNGIKTGLNSLAALNAPTQDFDNAFFEKLETPFEPGVKETFYTYYVEKSRLLPGDPARESIRRTLGDILHKHLPGVFPFQEKAFPEEASMLFFEIRDGNELAGAVFIRNSGTEDKSALYLRGKQELQGALEQIGQQMHLALLQQLKKSDNPFAICEQKILQKIKEKTFTTIQDAGLETSALPVERILNEMELKEKLIQRTPEGWFLTTKGQAFLAPSL